MYVTLIYAHNTYNCIIILTFWDRGDYVLVWT